MKARHIVICLALSLWGTGLQAQTDLPQVFSPNAAELGKNGRIPVSYFNGLPNISIPLTELHAKNYTLPIYLTYHASGNKPDQHPGWVGLGWTLHAGGCINRIVNGMKDETTKEERGALTGATPPEHPGYLFQGGRYYNRDWTQESLLDSLMNSQHYTDGCPDEFQINMEGLNASFYFTGNGDVRIVSKEDETFRVEYEISSNCDETFLLMGTSHDYDDLSVKKMSYLKGFVITKKDGTKLHFGGDDSYIEYEVSQNGDNRYISGIPLTDQGWNGIAMANTWLLRKIERTNGESIFFEYERRGTPIVRRDAHSIQYKFVGGVLDEMTSTLDQNGRQYKLNIHYSFLKPLYLKAIYCKLSKARLDFENEKTTELDYKIESSEFITRLGRPAPFDTLSRYNYYCQLSSIKSERGDEIDFNYTENVNERLKLTSVVFKDGNHSVSSYRFFYNPEPLPDYNARMSDIWGYYMGDLYRVEDFYSTVPGEVIDQEVADAARRHVNARYLQAEILDSLIYPTGGWTKLEYEPHTYSKVVNQFPFEIQCQEGMAGGLRVKRITNGLPNGKIEQRSFVYSDGNISTGILSGNPTSVLKGYHNVNNHYGFWQWDFPTSIFPVYISGSLVYDCKYIIYAERYLNQLSTTFGAHVTYSKVTEYNSTAESGLVEYYYSNHDTPGCMDFSPTSIYGNLDNTIIQENINSMELSRGNQIKKIIRNTDGQIVLQEENIYHSDTLDFIPMLHRNIVPIGNYSRITYSKVFSFYPKLTRKIVTTHPDDGGAPHIEIIDYTYDSHRRLTEVKRTSGGVVERDRYSYTGDYTNAPYSGMIQRNMVSLPVEHLHYRKDYQQPEKLVGAELVTWKSSGSYYVPAGQWSAGLGGTGVDAASFTVFSGTGKDSRYGNTPDLSYTHYDANGNLVLSEDRASRPTAYLWTPDGCRPAAIIPGASVPYVRRDSSDVPKSQVYNALTQGQTRVKDFECVAPFTLMLMLMCPSGQNWFVEAYVDGERYPMTRINSSYTGGDWSGSGLGQYPFSLQIPLSGGAHSVRVRAGQNYHPDYATDVGCTFIINYREKRVTNTTVSGPTVVFEDFEEDGNHTAEAFRSGKSRKGVWTHALHESFGPYWVDYRVFRNGRWNYVRQSASGSSVAINEGTAPIDHVRIYPMGSLPESYTWWPDGNLRSRTDAQGVTESYRYDGLGRLSGVYDNDGNKVEGYQYNYQNR